MAEGFVLYVTFVRVLEVFHRTLCSPVSLACQNYSNSSKYPLQAFFVIYRPCLITCQSRRMINIEELKITTRPWPLLPTVTNRHRRSAMGYLVFFLLKLVTHWKFHFEALVGNFTGHVSKCDTCQGRIFFVSITMGNEYNKQICDSYEMGTKSVDVVFLLKISHPNRV